MSSKSFTLTMTNDQILRKQIRGIVPLRESRIHKVRKEKRVKNREWQEMQDWQ
jgi:hypothetical protein